MMGFSRKSWDSWMNDNLNDNLRGGWVRLYRSFIRSSIWTMPEAWTKLALACMLLANHKPAKWRDGTAEISIPAGSFMASLRGLAAASNISLKQTRGGLEALEKEKFITILRAQRWTMVSVCNWGTYQSLNDERGTAKKHPRAQLGAQAIDDASNSNDISYEAGTYPQGTTEGTVGAQLGAQLGAQVNNALSLSSSDIYKSHKKAEGTTEGTTEGTKQEYKNKRESSLRSSDIPLNPDKKKNPEKEKNQDNPPLVEGDSDEPPFETPDSERSEAWNLTAPSRDGKSKNPIEKLIAAYAQRIFGRHKKKRGCSLAMATAKLRTACSGMSVARVEKLLERIDTSHQAWCRSYAWTKDDGEYQKGLEPFLNPKARRWEVLPDAEETTEDPGDLPEYRDPYGDEE